MSPPAARVGDFTGHGTSLGPGPGAPTVLIGGMPAWRAMSDAHICPLSDGPKPHAGGVVSDFLYHKTGNVRFARLSVILVGFVGAFLSLLPMLYIHDLNVIAACLSSGFFFAELIIGPIWSIPMDIAPKYSGTGSGIMNTGSAVAAIISPVAAGIMIDQTGNWELPFIVTMGLLALGTVLSFTMRPDKPFEDPAAPRLAPAK